MIWIEGDYLNKQNVNYDRIVIFGWILPYSQTTNWINTKYSWYWLYYCYIIFWSKVKNKYKGKWDSTRTSSGNHEDSARSFQNLPHATGLQWDQCLPDKEGGWKQCCLGKETNYNPLILQPLSREGETTREETSWNTTGLQF